MYPNGNDEFPIVFPLSERRSAPPRYLSWSSPRTPGAMVIMVSLAEDMSAITLIALGIAFLISSRLGGLLLILLGLAGGSLEAIASWLGQILEHLLP